jgi:LmbE family N-acetylglucosaminyl deacetylase
MKTQRRLLILAPHTDDGEFGCGASIARFIEEGADITYAALSTCEESLPEGFPSDTLKKEVKIATASLGIPPANLRLFNFKVRRFGQARQEILDELILLNRELAPDIVFCPSATDIHQDHAVVAAEAVRAFKRTTILGYELPWNNLTVSTTCFIKLEERHVDKKIESLQCYVSQRDRDYAQEQPIRALAVVRGTQVGVKFAETFEVVRWVM